jgi:glycosyltransferase involved in cell wall biosynthesis
MPFIHWIKARLRTRLWAYIFWRSASVFYTENELITQRLQKLFWKREVYTITNNYNQVFDHPENWKKKELTYFQGVQLLSVTSAGGHKNLPIALDVAKLLRLEHPGFRFRFVFTIDEKEFPAVPEELKDCFFFTGKVDISECPSLYDQCDFEFQSTLLECFTATFPEAMVMKRPIITTDLEFARGICGNAAVYYSPVSAKSAADAIYNLSIDKELQETLKKNGVEQLKLFDTNEERVSKLLSLCEQTTVKR